MLRGGLVGEAVLWCSLSCLIICGQAVRGDGLGASPPRPHFRAETGHANSKFDRYLEPHFFMYINLCSQHDFTPMVRQLIWKLHDEKDGLNGRVTGRLST